MAVGFCSVIRAIATLQAILCHLFGNVFLQRIFEIWLRPAHMQVQRGLLHLVVVGSVRVLIELLGLELVKGLFWLRY